MKICVAQIKPFAGAVEKNIATHKRLIEAAVSFNADLITFPELSLTGYEPSVRNELAIRPDEELPGDFQTISNENNIIIGAGMPVRYGKDIRIGLLFYQPGKKREIYCKRFLHEDELPFFIPGSQQLILNHQAEKIAPAICYESRLPQHAEQAVAKGATIYIASVAKTPDSLERSFKHYPIIAKQYSIPVFLSNFTGPSDNFISGGKSSVWNKEGKLKGQLDEISEGILVMDTETEEVNTFTLQPCTENPGPEHPVVLDSF
jgi:predicted amidohydrolase